MCLISGLTPGASCWVTDNPFLINNSAAHIGMLLPNLCLLACCCHQYAPLVRPSTLAEANASNAQDVLQATRVYATLDDAITDLTYLYAATARPR